MARPRGNIADALDAAAEGSRGLIDGAKVTMPTLLKLSSDVAAIMKAIVQLSDDVKSGASPLDTQGRLLRLQSSIQKSRPRIVKHIDDLCDMIDAEKASSMTSPPRCTCAAEVNPNIPHSRTCPLASPESK
jgi:hypothetical protein